MKATVMFFCHCNVPHSKIGNALDPMLSQSYHFFFTTQLNINETAQSLIRTALKTNLNIFTISIPLSEQFLRSQNTFFAGNNS